jgi:hypothetical protein
MNIIRCSLCKKVIKLTFLILFLLVVVSPGCKESTTGPSQVSANLLVNSFFESNGMPSLQGWTVSDTSNVHFSKDIPPGGLGLSIILNARWFGPWPNGSIYQMVEAPVGNHRYRLSVFGKRIGVGGAVDVHVGFPADTNSIRRISLSVQDTVWTYYSLTDTITIRANDILYLTISGGATEIRSGTSWFNSCTVEKLD